MTVSEQVTHAKALMLALLANATQLVHGCSRWTLDQGALQQQKKKEKVQLSNQLT